MAIRPPLLLLLRQALAEAAIGHPHLKDSGYGINPRTEVKESGNGQRLPQLKKIHPQLQKLRDLKEGVIHQMIVNTLILPPREISITMIEDISFSPMAP